ncbi:hypothetical protein [Streptomyces sp. NPDC000410]|uniref:SCO7613 C-terminal domain-containing membrane protein n=1 Tax=Streptomyces sp. NPDC000410 TaxID=3154254 RepID=UPI00333393E7
MENVPPPAEELRLLDRELAQIDARRAQLLARRAWLLQALRPVTGAPTGTVWAAGPAGPRPGHGHGHGAGPETSPPSAQNVLLTLGGILLAVAAIAFTLVSWGYLGIGGRSAVLGVVTVAALAAPVPLLRRGLTSTAESVAALGLVLMVLDAYALHRVALPGTDGLGYAAVASGALAALWAAYGLAFEKLRIPLPTAVITAQLPLPLWALAADASAWVIAWATLATAALDLGIATAARAGRGGTGRIAVLALAVTGAVVTGGWSLLARLWLSMTAATPPEALEPALLLLSAAGLALYAAWRVPSAAWAGAGVAGLAAIAGVGGVLRTALPGGWAVPGYLLCAVALLAAVRTAAPRGVLLGLARASGLVHAASAAWAVPPVALTLLHPLTGLDTIWSGAPAPAASDMPVASSAPVVLAAVSAALWCAPRLLPALGLPRTATSCAALALAWSTALAIPTTLSLPYPATLTIQLLLVTCGLWVVVRPGVLPGRSSGAESPGAEKAGREATGPETAGPESAGHKPAADTPAPARPAAATGSHVSALAVTALVCALATALSVAMLSLATRPATFTVLAVLVTGFTAAAVRARGPVRSVLACAAVVWTTGLVGAAAAAAGLPAHRTAIALLAVPAATALLGARLGRHPVALPVELTGAAGALLAVGLAATDLPTLTLVLALSGVIAAGTAVRPERRVPAGYLATALFVVATWVRLAASEVTVPEAYTLPVTLPALAIGALRRRRDPEASSWLAYGPGLAATLLPSLVAAWGDAHWPRPLLLGVAALAVTLLGARLRLQAPLVLGGLTLALDALHELAPYVVQAVGALPRWLPPALAGLLLLAVGATYEQRLRDARRLRDTLGRMR